MPQAATGTGFRVITGPIILMAMDSVAAIEVTIPLSPLIVLVPIGTDRGLSIDV